LKDLNQKPLLKFIQNVAIDFPSDLVPEFASATYRL